MSARPVILAVDNDVHGLDLLRGALERRYDRDYRIVARRSAREGLEELRLLASKGEEVALVIADQWMPEMTGSELLGRTHELHRDAMRALLVGWGDRRASPTILEGCAFGKLDNYILKPFQPEEVHLYPLVTEFLAAWTRETRPGMELVRMVGLRTSPRCTELRNLFERNGIPFGFYEVDSEQGQNVLRNARLDGSRLPVLVLLNGRALVDPSNMQIADLLGASTAAEEQDCDVLIVGAGPAGLAAAVYTASEGLRTIVLEREAMGGQAGTSSLIRNYLGFPRGISGAELAQRAYQQAWLFGAKYVFAREATHLRARGIDRIVTLSDGREISARAVLVATGARYRKLSLPQLERFEQAGIYYTAGGDMRVMRGRDVWIVGGGNSAGQAVVHLAKYCRHVGMLVRGEALSFSMSNYLVQEIERLPNVEIRFHTEVVGGGGDAMLDHLVVRDRHTGRTERIDTEVVFVLIGATPHTEWLGNAVARESHGFILTGRDLGETPSTGNGRRPALRFETSMPGVFAVGDVRHGAVQRVASAVGEGAVAVAFIHDYLASPVGLGRPERRDRTAGRGWGHEEPATGAWTPI